MARAELDWAIENSVHWYDALCEAHAVPGEHHPAYWINWRRMPPYMSNFVTLSDGADASVQVAAIRALIAGSADCGVKDSFQSLSLGELGLRVLFHATWICRPAGKPPPDANSELLWRVVRTEPELQAWEHTWRGAAGNTEALERAQIFRPSLLHRPDFRFLLGERGGQAVGAAALNRSGHALGLSNVCGATEAPAQLFPGCVRLACSLFPGLPLVGYERDADLSAALAVGFEAVHGLTVWVPERASP